MQPGDGGFVSFVGTPDQDHEKITPPTRPVPWSELAAQRWGPAVGDPEPGLTVPPAHVRRGIDPAAAQAAQDDRDAIVERACIRSETPGGGYEEPGWVAWARGLAPAEWDRWRARATRQLHAAATRHAVEEIRRGRLCAFSAPDLDRACVELVTRGSITLSIDAATGERVWTIYDRHAVQASVFCIRQEWTRYGVIPPALDTELAESCP